MTFRGRIYLSLLCGLLAVAQLSPVASAANRLQRPATQARAPQVQVQGQITKTQLENALVDCAGVVDCLIEELGVRLCELSPELCNIPAPCWDGSTLPINTERCVSQIDGVLLLIDSLEDLIPDVDWETILDDIDVPSDDCGKPNVGTPGKSAKYTIAVSASESCASSHEWVAVAVTLEVKRGGTWDKVSSSGAARANSSSSGTATATAACPPDTNRKYRGVAVGDSSDTPPHTKVGAPVQIGCPTGAQIVSDPLP